MHVMRNSRPRRMQRRMYLPSERQVVNGVGLGDVDGMFNIGKMFTRMFTFTPSSFKMKNIAGAIGSVATTISTGGIANVVSEFAGPSGLKLTKGTITGAHSKPMQYVGYGTMAAAAAAGLYFGGGAAISALKSGGTVAATAGGAGTAATTGGTFLSTVGSGLMTGIKAIGQVLPMLGKVLGGGGSPQQQGGGNQAEYDAQVQAYQQQQAQAAYEAQVREQQLAMQQPGYTPSIPYVTDQYGSPMMGQPASMQSSYGDLRSPYTAITEDGTQVQVDPATGKVIQAGMIPDLSLTTWLAIGGATAIGWYFMSGSKSIN